MNLEFVIRPVQENDLSDLVELAQHLDTVNFPNDRNKIQRGIQDSVRSFSGQLADPKNGEYQFVLEDLERKKVLGVSKIIAFHGTTEQPHYFWQISYDRRESKSIGIGITHQVLKLGKDTHGHTEIAGIIVDPNYQGKSLGKQLFYVRFLFIALNRAKFVERILSELLPPLDRENKSALWEAYGRKFTGLTYQEADQLSHDTKEFIEALFPQHEIYTCLLPLEARQVIGKVGNKSLPVKHLAEKNGFKFLEQIDPFDGGPHFGCRRDEVIAVKNTVTAPLVYQSADSKFAKRGLICVAKNQGQDFAAFESDGQILQNPNRIGIPKPVAQALSVDEGNLVSFLPYT